MKNNHLTPFGEELSKIGSISSSLASVGEIARHAFSSPISSDESPSIEKTTHIIHPKRVYSRSNLYELYEKNDDHCKAPRNILKILCRNKHVTEDRMYTIIKKYGSKNGISKEQKISNCLKGIRKKIKPYGFEIKKIGNIFKLQTSF